MTSAALPPEALTLGLARIARVAFAKGDLSGIFNALLLRLKDNPRDAAAMIDLATILEAQGQADLAATLRTDALRVRRSFATVHGDGSGPVLAALVTPGSFLANTPVDFLLEGSDAVHWQVFVDGDTAGLDLPPHDAVMVAVGEAPGHRATLARIGALLPSLGRPALNGHTDRIAALTRDGVAQALAGVPGLVVPAVLRLDRAGLAALAGGAALPEGLAWPLVLRPEGSHAGAGLEKVLDAGHLGEILADTVAESFFLSPFVDYRGPLGLFAKARVVLVGGRPFPVHLALSESWIVHYLSAGMEEDAARRAVEAEFFAGFDEGFARRHADALAAMQARIGLDYWGMDCAELADGRLLLFEVDTALIVHNMDDPQIFPYKQAPMQGVAESFLNLVQFFSK